MEGSSSRRKRRRQSGGSLSLSGSQEAAAHDHSGSASGASGVSSDSDERNDAEGVVGAGAGVSPPAARLWWNESHRLLGQGSYGAVRCCWLELPLGSAPRPCAVKRFLGRSGVGLSQNVVREVVALCGVPRHPNIVAPELAFIDDTNHVQIVFQRQWGDSSRFLTAVGQLSWPHVTRWCAQLVDALAHMHTHGFCHRDVKLENILVSPSRGEDIVLADLGMARYMPVNDAAPLPLTAHVCTVWTRAPELCLQQHRALSAKYDQKVDAWSAACVMMAFAAGRYVLRCSNNADDMLPHIFQLCGKPKAGTWPLMATAADVYENAFAALPESAFIRYDDPSALQRSVTNAIGRPDIPRDLLEAICKLLRVRPADRQTMAEAAATPFWASAIAAARAPMTAAVLSTSGHPPPSASWPMPASGLTALAVPPARVLVCPTMCPAVSRGQPPPRQGPSRHSIVSWLCRRLVTPAYLAVVIDAIHTYDDFWANHAVPATSEVVCLAACASLTRKVHDVTPGSPSYWSRLVGGSCRAGHVTAFEWQVIRATRGALIRPAARRLVSLLTSGLDARLGDACTDAQRVQACRVGATLLAVEPAVTAADVAAVARTAIIVTCDPRPEWDTDVVTAWTRALATVPILARQADTSDEMSA